MAGTDRSGTGPGDGHSRARAATEEAGDSALARIDARRLFGDAREIILVYERQDYRLRRTNSGKLILTK